MHTVVYSYPRSASTMVLRMLNLYTANDGNLRECFNPSYGIVDRDGRIRLTAPDERIEQSNDERLEMLGRYPDRRYVFKLHSGHLAHDPGLLDKLTSQYECEFITLERRNPFHAFVSTAVAHQYQYWGHREEKPTFEPFRVSPVLAASLATNIATYYQRKPDLPNVRASLVFEDIISLPATVLLAEMGYPHYPATGQPLPDQKQNGFDLNLSLIQNLDEIGNIFHCIVDPQMKYLDFRSRKR